MRVIMFGAPGVGKGSVSEVLKDLWHLPYVGVGETLRKEIADETPLGLSIKELLQEGHFVDDGIINEMMRNALGQQEDYLLDGFPRNIVQAKFYLWEIHNPSFVVHLKAPEAVLVERMLARGREDDTEDTIRQRLAQYDYDTAPVLEYFGLFSSFPILEVESVGGIEAVARKVRETILDFLDRNQGFYP